MRAYSFPPLTMHRHWSIRGLKPPARPSSRWAIRSRRRRRWGAKCPKSPQWRFKAFNVVHNIKIKLKLKKKESKREFQSKCWLLDLSVKKSLNQSMEDRKLRRFNTFTSVDEMKRRKRLEQQKIILSNEKHHFEFVLKSCARYRASVRNSIIFDTKKTILIFFSFKKGDQKKVLLEAFDKPDLGSLVTDLLTSSTRVPVKSNSHRAKSKSKNNLAVWSKK